MIGRLGLELGHCHNHFRALSYELFGQPQPWYRGIFAPRYSHLEMEAQIRTVIKSAGLHENALMQAAPAGHPTRQM